MSSKETGIQTYKIDDALKVRTVEQSLSTYYPALSKVRKDHGEQKAVGFLMHRLAELIEYIGVKNQITSNTLEVMAYDILTEHYELTTADIAVICYRIRTAYYGEIYNNINPIKIMQYIRMYDDEKKNKAGEKSRLSHDKAVKKGPYKSKSFEWMKNKLNNEKKK